MAELPVGLDHCVIHVSDWEVARDFYTRVIGTQAIGRGDGTYVFRLGRQQLNVHGPGLEDAAPLARVPVVPGNSDLCFCWNGPIETAIEHLATQGVVIELGPVERYGAQGPGTSVYFRDPDGSLMEFMSYGH
ncbi:VOC family protein [Rhizobium halophytocola]|uniref:Catechol 2,3-dioxygenase-like lactoylglutathione lyase family enzyme n=1 Tax=Rhizobium halophytocola TaxID=735519 RepID=A0ABS4DZG0_9HYPH|nr:VOC family protein [Rhizobium halophytocola]MBP1851073.1 catechol 2,3-dioxygenase-like lactoylglutathione lyase family enzyme [Rhizobium halophytocola]